VTAKWRIPAYIAIGALVLYLFGRWEGRAGQESSAVIEKAQTALAMGHSFRLRQDSLTKRAERALAASTAKDRVIQGLRASLAHDSTPRDSMVTYVYLTDSLTAQRDSLYRAVRLLTVRAERAESRVAELEANLHATLEVAECHLLGAHWLPKCPSRTAMWLLGVGTGAVAVLVTHH
jgi:hypothetical protein